MTRVAQGWLLGWLALSACNGTPGDLGEAGVAFAGGSVVPPGCGYSVHTGFGATAPELADPDGVGSSAAPAGVHLGFAADPATNMVVGWHAPAGTTTDVELTLETAFQHDQSRPALTWRYQDLGGELWRAFEAHLCDLQPDTEYTYRIRSGDTYSPPARFRTAPDPAVATSATTVILVLGDSRGGPEVFGRLLESADQQYAPDLLLFTGDAVLDGRVQAQWDDFLDQGQPLLARIPSVLTIGNHEDGDQIFTTLWAMPGDEHWFSFDYGAAHIVVLDDSPSLYPDLDGAGESFLRQDLPTVASGTWKLVMHHQPMISATAVDGHGPAQRLRERWMPILDQHRVDLVVSGHNHRYERSLPLRDGQAVDHGTIYLTTAGAGAPLYQAPLEAWTAVAVSTYHFVVLRVSRSRIEAIAIDQVGNQLDSFTLVKRQLGD